jgi:hypothetical protein
MLYFRSVQAVLRRCAYKYLDWFWQCTFAFTSTTLIITRRHIPLSLTHIFTMSGNKAAWISAPSDYPLQVKEASMPTAGSGEIVIKNAAVSIVSLSSDHLFMSPCNDHKPQLTVQIESC